MQVAAQHNKKHAGCIKAAGFLRPLVVCALGGRLVHINGSTGPASTLGKVTFKTPVESSTQVLETSIDGVREDYSSDKSNLSATSLVDEKRIARERFPLAPSSPCVETMDAILILWGATLSGL